LSKVTDFNIPHLYSAPHWGLTPLSIAMIFGIRKLESPGYRMALLACYYI